MKKLFIALLITVFATPQLMADKGMWLLQLMRQQNLEDRMRAQGLEISVDEIYTPGAPSIKDAIGIFGGGCTGEVVSPNGLVLTNHHCGFSFIQQLSTVEHNYLHNGFWSQSYEEELPCENLAFTFVVKIQDVTDTVNGLVKSGKITEEESFSRQALAKIGKELFAADNIEGKEHMYPQLLPYFEGNKYYLVYYKKYTDVRLVGTPPNSIGKFGGDTDNWVWPRHTGDYSIFRIYVSPDGKAVEYSEDNVPYKPNYHFPISLKGAEKGDFTFVFGYPARTNEYLPAVAVHQEANVIYPVSVDLRGKILDIYNKHQEKDPKVRIQYASTDERETMSMENKKEKKNDK